MNSGPRPTFMALWFGEPTGNFFPIIIPEETEKKRPAVLLLTTGLGGFCRLVVFGG